MSPEEKERWDRFDQRLEFLAANIESLHAAAQEQRDLIARNSEQIGLNSEQIGRISEQIGRISEQIGRHSEVISRFIEQLGLLAGSQETLQDLVLRLGRVVEAQAKAQEITDERLKILLDVVERHISDRRN